MTALLLLSTASVLSARVPPEVKCADLKAKAAAIAVYARAQCAAKAVLDGTSIASKCLLKAETKLRASFAKADSKGTCPGDADTALAAGDACATSFEQAVSGAARCAAVKLKAAGTKVRDKTACARKAVDKGSDDGLAECIDKAESKFAAAIAKGDGKGSCTGTASDLETLVDACVATLALVHCDVSGNGTCGGSCPAGLTCRPYEVFANGASVEAGCSCVDVANGPACGAPVCSADQHCDDPTYVCEQWKDGDPLDCDHTICQPALTVPPPPPPGPENTTLCDGGEFPTCGGTCPDGLRCQSIEAFFQGDAIFAGCICVDPKAPRCEAGPECNVSAIQFTHCADPSLTCLVTLDLSQGGDKPSCTEAHCGAPAPIVTTTSSSTSSTTTTSSSSTSTSSSTSSTTTTLPCVSTPSVSGCFEDLGDCTVRDNCTGLQWEQKQTRPGPHDVNNRYVWSGCCDDGCQTGCQPNAAAKATCLATAETNTDGCTDQCPTGTCYVERGGIAVTTIFDWVNQLNAENFAGHNDWRVPTEAGFNLTGSRELESIVRHPCAGSPCIDPIFGPTIPTGYWSRTGDAGRSIDAWFVNFFDGPYSNLTKREALFVRAVR